MLKTIACICCCCAVFAAAADETTDSAVKPGVDEQAADKSWLDKYYPYEQRVAGWVDNSARGVDSFFGTADAWSTENKSWLRITTDFNWDQVNQGAVELRPRLKLDVPTASKRLRLLVENDSPEQRTAVQEAIPNLRTTDNERTTVVGVGASLDKWAPQWKKSLQAGIHVALPPEPYVRFIAKRQWQFAETWTLDSYNRLAWFERQGYSVNSEISFGEPLTPRWRIDFPTNLTWREDRDYLDFSESANLTHIIDERTAITYGSGVTGTGFQGPQITGYFISADYRRNISRRIVFIDLIPAVAFPREYGFNPRAGFTFRFELYFQKNIQEQ